MKSRTSTEGGRDAYRDLSLTSAIAATLADNNPSVNVLKIEQYIRLTRKSSSMANKIELRHGLSKFPLLSKYPFILKNNL